MERKFKKMPDKDFYKMNSADSLVNSVAGMNVGTDRLPLSHYVASRKLRYYEMGEMYRSWLGRRVVDLIPDEALKKNWIIKCPSWGKDKIKELEKYYLNELDLKNKLLSSLKAQRVFGGSVILCITTSRFGSFQNRIPKILPKGTLLNLQSFDAWQAFAVNVNYMDPITTSFQLPNTYAIANIGLASNIFQKGNNYMNGASGETTFPEYKDGNQVGPGIAGTLVDRSRICRFDGLNLPWYFKQRNLYWGQSLLENVFDAVRNADIITNALASLLFRASVPVYRVDGLASVLTDPNSRAVFEERLNYLNSGMSNNNMAVIDKEEELVSFEPGTLTGLDPVFERFYIVLASAANIPVTKLIGESARGLNATGKGDANNYADVIETYQANVILPNLMQLLANWIIPSFFGEEAPNDFDIVFEKPDRITAEEQHGINTIVLNNIILAKDAGLINTEIARKELLINDIFTSLTEEDVEEMNQENLENMFEAEEENGGEGEELQTGEEVVVEESEEKDEEMFRPLEEGEPDTNL